MLSNDPLHPSLRRCAAGAAGLLLVLLAACTSSQERPSAPVTITAPSRINVVTVDRLGVYDTMAKYMGDAGISRDKERSNRDKGTWTSQRVRCAPAGDERHTGWCVFSVDVQPGGGAVASTIVMVKVRVPERVDYDPALVKDQITVESVLDRIATELRSRFAQADVIQSDAVQF